jgi:hypothetical protein
MGSATTFGVEELMKLHRGFIERGQVKRLGKMIKLVLGEVPSGVTLRMSAAEIAKEGRTLDWFERGPVIGLSPGDVDLLVASPVVPLPDKPDPNWIAPVTTQAEIERAVTESGRWTPPRAPLVPQLPEDRGARRIKGTNTLLFEPVHQVLFRPEGINVFGCVEAMTDDASGTVMTFVWNFDEGRGYFYGGRFLVKI